MATQSERREATRGRILEAATALFAEQGFEATSTQQILDAAGTSRGALYHHFDTKQAIFEAVFEQVSDEAVERASRGPAGSSALETLTRASLRWLREVRRPEVGAILIEQGPQVLGWKRARDLEARSSLGLVTRSLEAAVEAGELRLESVQLAARFLNAALAEAALASIYGEGRLSRATLERSISQLIEGLGGVG